MEIPMFNPDVLRRTVLGAAAATLAIGTALASPAVAAAGEVPGAEKASDFGQVAAAPVHTTAPVNQIVGTVGAPLVNVNVPCPAPWQQGGLLGSDYNACNTASVFQQNAGVAGDLVGTNSHRDSGFGQTAAAPVYADAPINQVVGTVGAPLVNVNIPCPAAWNQGGLLGADYNACNTAPVYQQDAGVAGDLGGDGRVSTDGPSGFGQVAAAPVHTTAPINQIVGTVGAPLVNVNVPCPAPWQQGGLLGSDYNACSTAPVYQQDAPVLGSLVGKRASKRQDNFGQTAAAPVRATAPISQIVGTVAAPLANVNVPCPAPWQQGGLLGSDYNACNTAAVFQQDAGVNGDLIG
jgi:hypothetical protein